MEIRSEVVGFVFLLNRMDDLEVLMATSKSSSSVRVRFSYIFGRSSSIELKFCEKSFYLSQAHQRLEKH
jgi:hypothetical protein